MLEWHDLNARTEATFLWLSFVLILGIAKSSEVRIALVRLLRVLVSTCILWMVIGLLLCVSTLSLSIVFVGRQLGFWDTLPVVASTIWAFTAGFSLLLHIGEFIQSKREFRTTAIKTLLPSTVLVEVIGLAVFPFWAELLIIPCVTCVAYIHYSNDEGTAKTIADGLLALLTFGLLGSVLYHLIANPTMWEGIVQTILFPLLLTIGTLPYILIIVLVERWRFIRKTVRRVVTAREYGADWPLTVNSAKLCCLYPAVWVEVNGKRYGVNGTADGLLKNRGFACLNLHEIWRDNPESEWFTECDDGAQSGASPKVNVSRLLQDGLALASRV